VNTCTSRSNSKAQSNRLRPSGSLLWWQLQHTSYGCLVWLAVVVLAKCVAHGMPFKSGNDLPLSLHNRGTHHALTSMPSPPSHLPVPTCPKTVRAATAVPAAFEQRECACPASARPAIMEAATAVRPQLVVIFVILLLDALQQFNILIGCAPYTPTKHLKQAINCIILSEQWWHCAWRHASQAILPLLLH
jgi:hypothetical protein